MIPTTKSVEAVAPILLLGMALAALLFWPIPVPNRELLTAIISGLLGYLSKSRNDTSPAVSIDPPAKVQVDAPGPQP